MLRISFKIAQIPVAKFVGIKLQLAAILPSTMSILPLNSRFVKSRATTDKYLA